MDTIYGHRPASNGREIGVDSATALLETVIEAESLSTFESASIIMDPPSSPASTPAPAAASTPGTSSMTQQRAITEVASAWADRAKRQTPPRPYNPHQEEAKMMNGSPKYVQTLTEYSYYVFTAILMIEVLLKLVASGVLRLIRISWNLLDIDIILISIISIIFTKMKMEDAVPINPSTLRVCRVLRLHTHIHTRQ
ncbi:hypothetical protein L3Q82_000341 [Scortum barcoo]|uniref:Uncharacterized protein n=1 Tax=Scortum barcoo TaxID=214431 RepID=A0ACB8XB42_9TELE|nr:hypothetical protein L3Q82_000341 [Scortum barcoo]